RKENGPASTAEEEANPDAAATRGDDEEVLARARCGRRATHRQPNCPRLGQLLPLGKRGTRPELRRMAGRHESSALRKSTAPEATRKPHLDHVERAGNLR